MVDYKQKENIKENIDNIKSKYMNIYILLISQMLVLLVFNFIIVNIIYFLISAFVSMLLLIFIIFCSINIHDSNLNKLNLNKLKFIKLIMMVVNIIVFFICLILFYIFFNNSFFTHNKKAEVILYREKNISKKTEKESNLIKKSNLQDKFKNLDNNINLVGFLDKTDGKISIQSMSNNDIYNMSSYNSTYCFVEHNKFKGDKKFSNIDNLIVKTNVIVNINGNRYLCNKNISNKGVSNNYLLFLNSINR